MNTSKSWGVTRLITRCTSISGLAVYAGVWLRAKETEIRAALYAMWLRKDYYLNTYRRTYRIREWRVPISFVKSTFQKTIKHNNWQVVYVE